MCGICLTGTGVGAEGGGEEACCPVSCVFSYWRIMLTCRVVRADHRPLLHVVDGVADKR